MNYQLLYIFDSVENFTINYVKVPKSDMKRVLAVVENVMRSKVVNETSDEEILDEKLKTRLHMKMNKLIVKFAMKVQQEGEGFIFLHCLSNAWLENAD